MLVHAVHAGSERNVCNIVVSTETDSLCIFCNGIRRKFRIWEWTIFKMFWLRDQKVYMFKRVIFEYI